MKRIKQEWEWHQLNDPEDYIEEISYKHKKDLVTTAYIVGGIVGALALLAIAILIHLLQNP